MYSQKQRTMKTEIRSQWSEKVFGNVYTGSKAKMTHYSFTDNAFNDIPNEYWVELLNNTIDAPEVIQLVSGKKSKTQLGMLGAIESIELTIKSINEIRNSRLRHTHLEALAAMKKFNYEKLNELLNK